MLVHANANGSAISTFDGASKNTGSTTKLSAAERAEQRRQKLIWEESMLEAVMLKGRMVVSWKPLYTIDTTIYKFEENFKAKLTVLRLIGVQLKELPEDFGKHMIQLQILSLENNQLERLPDSITELINLEEFNVSFNQLTYLPDRIGFLFRLRVFPLNNNKLVELPITFGALTLLERVDLECNCLRMLPENLDNMASCHTFNVNRNCLIRIARCLARMPSLMLLSAAGNELAYIPLELYTSKTLRGLRLGSNMIKIISDRIGEMVQLQELILDYNHIAKLPFSVWKLKNLKILRMEGNEELLDPPTEVVIKGAKEVVTYFYNIYMSDKQARMRHIILSTQNVLQQINDRRIYRASLFEPDVKAQESSEDYWYALQITHFWKDLLPEMQQIWHYMQSRRIVLPDVITEFPFNEKEVMWAFTNYNDAYGPVLLYQKAMFRECSCKDNYGNPLPCIPPRQGFMCSRSCYLLKKSLVRQRDREDRVWNAYKSQSLIDAEKRAEVEAKSYLESAAGRRWVDDTAYDQAEELMLESGAAKAVEKRIAAAEKRKQKVIKRFQKKINKIQKIKDGKVRGVQDELLKLKESRKVAKEGYMKDGIEFKINQLTTQLARMPETIEIENLQTECQAECERIDEELYASSSEEEKDEDEAAEDDSDEYSSDDSTEEAKRWRKRRERKQLKLRRQQLLAYSQQRYGDKDDPKKIKNPVLRTAKVIKNTIKPIVSPIAKKIGEQSEAFNNKTSKAIRDILEVSKIRVRRLLLKFNGNFDEIQRELKYEIARQYVEHQVSIAREKARKEFNVIEHVRQKFQGVSKVKAFIAWKKWVWTKQKRMIRDTRRQYRTALQWVSLVNCL
jgi:Leucine-rich repeat (LRR) protein